jgi:hypothetical protein
MNEHPKTLTPEEFQLLLREFLADELKQAQIAQRTRTPSHRGIVFQKKNRIVGRPNTLRQPIGERQNYLWS